MYKTILIISLIASINLHAYSDYDMDGVEDKSDKCPNTSMMDLVDESGCTKESLDSPHHFGVSFGVSFSQSSDDTSEVTDTITQNLQASYYYKNFSLSASTSYYDSESVSYSNGGINDSYIGAYYRLDPIGNLNIGVGGGIIIPTYESDTNNNNIDYTLSSSFSYLFDSMTLFCGYSYTFVNDDDIDFVIYQNTNSYNAGIGFNPTDKLYASLSYNISESAYEGSQKIKTSSIYTNYMIDEELYTTFSYSYGLSDTASDHYASLNLGYNF